MSEIETRSVQQQDQLRPLGGGILLFVLVCIVVSTVASTSKPAPTSTITIAAETPTLSESERKQIYYEICQAQDEGVGDTRAYTRVSRKYGISENTAYEIAGEGAKKNWPLPPLR